MMKRALLLFFVFGLPLLGANLQEVSGNWLTGYYRNPQPTRFVDEVRTLINSGSFSKETAQPPLIVFLGRVIAANPTKIESWMAALNDLSPAGKDLLYAALWFSGTEEAKQYLATHGIKDYTGKNPPDVLKMEIDSPTVVEMLWGWYFATGDEAAIRRIISGFNLNRYDGAMDRFKSSKKTEQDKREAYQDLAFKAVQRSLIDNCTLHLEVQKICEKLYSGNTLNKTELLWMGVILSKVDPKKYRIEPGSTQWTENGKPISNRLNVKTVNGFGVMLFLTDNSQLFDSRTTSKTPNLNPMGKVQRGTPVYTALLLSAPGLDATHAADLTFDLRVRKPDGTIFAETKNAICWKGRYDAPEHHLQLSKGHIQIIPEGSPGIYTVEITVKDRIKNVELPVQATFEVL